DVADAVHPVALVDHPAARQHQVISCCRHQNPSTPPGGQERFVSCQNRSLLPLTPALSPAGRGGDVATAVDCTSPPPGERVKVRGSSDRRFSSTAPLKAATGKP